MKPTLLFFIFCALLPQFVTAASDDAKLTHYERKIVASCLVLEAAGEGIEGMQAVLNVIYNRADKRMDKVVCQVVKPMQFTSLNHVTKSATPDYSIVIRRALHDPLFNEAYKLVMLLEQNELKDNTGGADHYHASDMLEVPYWTSGMQKTVTIGSHIFYVSKAQASLQPAIADSQS